MMSDADHGEGGAVDEGAQHDEAVATVSTVLMFSHSCQCGRPA